MEILTSFIEEFENDIYKLGLQNYSEWNSWEGLPLIFLLFRGIRDYDEERLTKLSFLDILFIFLQRYEI